MYNKTKVGKLDVKKDKVAIFVLWLTRNNMVLLIVNQYLYSFLKYQLTLY